MWYYEQSGATQGPVPAEAVRQLIASGGIARSTQIWTEGQAGWMAAERTEFASAFQGGAPPLPGGPPSLPVPQGFAVPPMFGGAASADPNQNTANLIYILYIVGFFVQITAIVGVVMAYVNRQTANPLYRSHYDWQIKVFWTGMIAFGVIIGAYIFSGLLAIITHGLGLLMIPVILLASVAWLAWTIFAIVKGMSALGRQAPMTITGYW